MPKSQRRTFVVKDPISPADANSPAERKKKQRFVNVLIQAITAATEHGPSPKAWHVGVEMRSPVEVRDRFFVTFDVEGKRVSAIGPMSADVVDHLLWFVESGLQADLPGAKAGSCTRKITNLSNH
jgi:hypothetical protein